MVLCCLKNMHRLVRFVCTLAGERKPPRRWGGGSRNICPLVIQTVRPLLQRLGKFQRHAAFTGAVVGFALGDEKAIFSLQTPSLQTQEACFDRSACAQRTRRLLFARLRVFRTPAAGTGAAVPRR